MTFSDNSYDLVISTDVLEHIPEAKKQAFLDECLRVARGFCIIAAPFDTPGVDEAERIVNDFNKHLFGIGQDWLEEHLKFGKPKRELFLETLKRQKIAFTEFGTQNLTTWTINTHLNLIDAKLGLPNAKHKAANRYYNQRIMQMNEFTNPTYRHFFVMYVDGKAKQFDASRYLQAPTDEATLLAHVHMLIELVTDRIGELRAETTTLNEANSAILEELAQSKQKIADQQRILDRLQPLLGLARKPLVRKVRTAMHKQRR
jgi:hypothetical protein